MVDEIYDIKNKVLERMRQDIDERGVERMDVGEMYKMADIVKDMAEAEKACWEAEYYRSVSEAMESGAGYDGSMMGYGDSSGGNSGGSRGGSSGGRSGWQNQYGSGRGGGSRGGSRRGYGMGYHEHIDALKTAMQGADPQERERMMQEIRNMSGGMM